MPRLQKIKRIPLFTVDTATPLAINNTTSNNYDIGL
jgi:ribose transport system substrate-binding protein